jgi:hypothetical protein
MPRECRFMRELRMALPGGLMETWTRVAQNPHAFEISG